MEIQETFQANVVNENVIRSIPCPDTSDFDNDTSEPELQLSTGQVSANLALTKDDSQIKLTVRQQHMNFKSPVRAQIWKTLYLRMEAQASSTVDPLNAQILADATASLYQDTVQTCFGTQELLAEEIGLPSCVEHKLTTNYFLNNVGKLTVARILTCFAYNQPDIQYCPMLYPIGNVLIESTISINFLIFYYSFHFTAFVKRRGHLWSTFHYGLLQKIQVPLH